MRRPELLSILALALSACMASSPPDEDTWTVLFDGKTLDGWAVVHGDLPFVVRDGEIVGETAVDVTTRYLTTAGRYDDFVLELEVNNSTGENTGIQFRSVTDAPFYAGLTGYQLEIDPSDRGWTGGIYFEGVGEWSHPPINNPACPGAWRPSAWNKLRIEARGEQMRTFVNGVACAYLFDEYLDDGHIGLQIHSIGADPASAGAETRWRNIRILENPEADDYTPDDLSADSHSRLIDRLSPIELANGWRLARSQVEENASGWTTAEIRNPIDSESQTAHVLDLSAEKPASSASFPMGEDSYEVVLDMQIEPGTEGEVVYPVPGTDDHGQAITCLGSYRIFDDRSLEPRSPDDPNLIGSLTGRLPAKNLSEPGRDKRVLYEDAWRRLGLIVQDSSVEHWLNSVKVVEYAGCEVVADPVSTAGSIVIRIDKGRAIFRTIKYRE